MATTPISQLLHKAHNGSDDAREMLFTELHGQMRVYARRLMLNERPDHTLHATALVNEACLKIISEGVVDSSESRRQLFHAAIRAMRQVLIDHARARNAQKRSGSMGRQPLDIILDQFESSHKLSFLDLEVALERLQRESPREHDALTLRFFGGLTVEETAQLMGCSKSTVESDWRLARAKLVSWLREPDCASPTV